MKKVGMDESFLQKRHMKMMKEYLPQLDVLNEIMGQVTAERRKLVHQKRKMRTLLSTLQLAAGE